MVCRMSDTEPTAVQPEQELEAPVADRTRLRDLVFGLRALVAVALAGLILGGLAGFGIHAATDGDGEDGRMGRFGPGGGFQDGPGGPGGRGGPGGFPQVQANRVPANRVPANKVPANRVPANRVRASPRRRRGRTPRVSRQLAQPRASSGLRRTPQPLRWVSVRERARPEARTFLRRRPTEVCSSPSEG